jgi:hypothetical protein
MSETYDVRGDIEQLHENKHLRFSTAPRGLKMKKLEMMEYIARNALVRITSI